MMYVWVVPICTGSAVQRPNEQSNRLSESKASAERRLPATAEPALPGARRASEPASCLERYVRLSFDTALEHERPPGRPHSSERRGQAGSGPEKASSRLADALHTESV